MNRLIRLIMVAMCFSMFTACSENPIDRLIPLSATKGGLANFTVSGINVQEGKSRNGGMLVSGLVMVPHDIKREQVKPTLLAAVKGLKDQYGKCEWIIVYAIPSQELKGTGINAGMAEYAEGKIRIDYGVPSTMQLAAEVGAAKEIGDPDSDPLRLMIKDEFDLAVAVDTTWQGLYEPNRQHKGNIEEKLLKLTAQKMNIPVTQVKKLRKQLIMYYGPFWGNETIG